MFRRRPPTATSSPPLRARLERWLKIRKTRATPKPSRELPTRRRDFRADCNLEKIRRRDDARLVLVYAKPLPLRRRPPKNVPLTAAAVIFCLIFRRPPRDRPVS